MHADQNHFPDQLSGGMKQRIGIVRARAAMPRVLLLDAPFGALDAQTRMIIRGPLPNVGEGLKISALFVNRHINEPIVLSDGIYVVTAAPGRIRPS
jgi:NitT/TauT family transport system ATP-binding protein